MTTEVENGPTIDDGDGAGLRLRELPTYEENVSVCLSEVDQEPSGSIENALSSLKKALVAFGREITRYMNLRRSNRNRSFTVISVDEKRVNPSRDAAFQFTTRRGISVAASSQRRWNLSSNSLTGPSINGRMSGSGNGVCADLAISNAIANLCGESRRVNRLRLACENRGVCSNFSST